MKIEKQASDQNLLLDGAVSPGKVIWMLAWPVILDQTFQTMVNYVDSAMVGSLGASATAAVAVNMSTIWLVNGMMYAFGAAFGVLAARQIGARNLPEVQRIVKQALLAVIASSVVVTIAMNGVASSLPIWIGVEKEVVPEAIVYMRYIALAYPFTITFMYCANLIRSSGDTRSPLICNIITNLVNVVGNFLLIFPTRTLSVAGIEFTMPGAGLGVKGAAISTAVATALSGIIVLSVLLIRKSPLKITTHGGWRPDGRILRQALRIGAPLAMERATLSLGQITLTVLVTRIGTIALAAHHLAITAESITYMPASGFSIAATTLVAQSLGAEKRELALKFAKRCLGYGVLLMTFTGAAMFIFAHELMAFFTVDAQVIALGAQVLRIEAFAEPFFAISIVTSGILRGAGDTKWPFIFSLIGMWVVRLFPASILVLVLGLGLEAAWSCMVADLVVRGVLNLVRFTRGRWMDSWKG